LTNQVINFWLKYANDPCIYGLVGF